MYDYGISIANALEIAQPGTKTLRLNWLSPVLLVFPELVGSWLLLTQATNHNGWPALGLIVCKADSRFAPSQWETVLLCNDVSHWLDASLESALYNAPLAFLTQSTWHQVLGSRICIHVTCKGHTYMYMLEYAYMFLAASCSCTFAHTWFTVTRDFT